MGHPIRNGTKKPKYLLICSTTCIRPHHHNDTYKATPPQRHVSATPTQRHVSATPTRHTSGHTSTTTFIRPHYPEKLQQWRHNNTSWRYVLCVLTWKHPVAVWLVALALCWQVARWDVVQPARQLRVESLDTKEGESQVWNTRPPSPCTVFFPLFLFCVCIEKMKGREGNYKTRRLWLYIWMEVERGSCGIVVVGGRSYAMGREWLRNQVVSQWAWDGCNITS